MLFRNRMLHVFASSRGTTGTLFLLLIQPRLRRVDGVAPVSLSRKLPSHAKSASDGHGSEGLGRTPQFTGRATLPKFAYNTH